MLLLFDFDGTLCDSVDEAISAANVELKRIRQPLISKAEIRNLGFKQIIAKRKINKLQILIAIFMYRRKLSQLVDTLDIFPGLKDTLIKLSEKHTLGVITSNSRSNVLAFLKHHKLESYFQIIESEFSYFGKHRKINAISKRLLVHKSTIFYIGDETRDVLAAKKAGVKSVAVSWGFEGHKVLKEVTPDFLISKPQELLKAV